MASVVVLYITIWWEIVGLNSCRRPLSSSLWRMTLHRSCRAPTAAAGAGGRRGRGRRRQEKAGEAKLPQYQGDRGGRKPPKIGLWNLSHGLAGRLFYYAPNGSHVRLLSSHAWPSAVCIPDHPYGCAYALKLVLQPTSAKKRENVGGLGRPMILLPW